MNKRLISILRYLVFAGLGALLLYYAYRDVDLAELWQDILQTNFWWVGFSILLGYLAIVSRGLRWLILLEPLGYRANKWNSIHSVNFGYFLNFFIPRSGELARCIALNRSDDVPVDKLFGTVISERVVDFCVLFIFMALAFFTHIKEFKGLTEDMNFDLFSLNSILIILGAALVLFLLWRVFKEKLLQSKFVRAVTKFFLGMKDGLKSIFKMKKVGWFLFHTVFIWGMYYLMAYVIFLAIEEISDISMSDALFIVVAGGLGMVFPSPGGTGSYQFAVKEGFRALGLSTVVGIKFGTIMWSAQNLMMLGTGLIALIALFLAIQKRTRAKQTDGAIA